MTHLFRGIGAEDDRVFCANEHLVFYAHTEAMKVFWKLWICRDIHAYTQNRQTELGDGKKKKIVFAYQVR